MKHKGFTLVELLAVIAIISLLLIFGFSAIIQKSKELNRISDSKVQELIKSITKNYINNNEELKKQLNTTGYIAIEFNELKDSGYLKDEIKNLENSSSINYSSYRVCVSKNESYEYSYQISDGRCSVNEDTINEELIKNSKKYLKANPSINDQLSETQPYTLTYSTLSTFNPSLSNIYVENLNVTNYAVCIKLLYEEPIYEVSNTGICD